jgi:hypothetical protein
LVTKRKGAMVGCLQVFGGFGIFIIRLRKITSL